MTVSVCSKCNTKKTETTAPLGHDWTAPEYVWSGDDLTVTASARCLRDGKHEAKETVKTLAELIKEPTLAETGEIVYYAVFTVEPFGMQIKDVILPAITIPCDGVSCPGRVFTDMPKKGHWSHDPIDWALVNGVTGGTSPTTFSPAAGCTRAQVVTFLWKAAGSPEPEETDGFPFTDVPEDAYYRKAVAWAVENEITGGTSPTTFSPKKTCTRAQIVTFLWRFEGSPEADTSGLPFTDVPEDAYYRVPVVWALGRGITAGVAADRFGSKNTCTRAQIVTFLYKDIFC